MDPLMLPMVLTKKTGAIIRTAPALNGERDRIRTCDPVIKSHLLYQLSYAPVMPLKHGRGTPGHPGTSATRIRIW